MVSVEQQMVDAAVQAVNVAGKEFLGVRRIATSFGENAPAKNLRARYSFGA
jgi:hypothetical protein